MKAIISVLGRFHAFHLAKELFNRNSLASLITSYPKSVPISEGIDSSFIKSLILNELCQRAVTRHGFGLNSLWNSHYFWSEWYDKRVSKILPAIIDKSKATICTAWSASGMHTLRVARSNGLTTIVERGSSHISYQDNILKEEYSLLSIPYKPIHPKIIEKELIEYDEADYISVPSSFSFDSFLTQGVSATKLIKIPYGVNLNRFFPHLRNEKKFIIGYCGAVSVRKGVPYLIQAFNLLAIPNAELWFIGDINPELNQYFSTIKLNNIKFMGHIPQSELPKLLSQCSIFCLPSVEEGLAMVIPQAMACGLPVICTHNTGGSDIVDQGKSGFIVPIRDHLSIAGKIEYLYKNEEARLEMGAFARKSAVNNQTWTGYGEKIQKAYELIEENKKAH